MDAAKYLNSEFDEHVAVVAATRKAVAAPFVDLLQKCVASLRQGGKIMFFGNGGSAADAQHLATELTARYKTNRKAIAAIALTTDTSALTAIANDFAYDQIFSRQIEAIGRPGDVAIGISTSGRSPNVIRALEEARAMNIVPAAFTGGAGGDLLRIANPLIIVPTAVTARIQEMHIAIGQMLCGAIEIELGLVSS